MAGKSYGMDLCQEVKEVSYSEAIQKVIGEKNQATDVGDVSKEVLDLQKELKSLKESLESLQKQTKLDSEGGTSPGSTPKKGKE